MGEGRHDGTRMTSPGGVLLYLELIFPARGEASVRLPGPRPALRMIHPQIDTVDT